MRRRRRTDGEINLTPLLDVLFVILFVVMLSGMQSEKTNADAREESREKIEALETEVEELTDEGRIAELEEQVRSLTEELEKRKDLEETGKAFESRAVLVTIRNTAEEQAGEGGAKAQAKHYLSVYASSWDRTGRSTRGRSLRRSFVRSSRRRIRRCRCMRSFTATVTRSCTRKSRKLSRRLCGASVKRNTATFTIRYWRNKKWRTEEAT